MPVLEVHSGNEARSACLLTLKVLIGWCHTICCLLIAHRLPAAYRGRRASEMAAAKENVNLRCATRAREEKKSIASKKNRNNRRSVRSSGVASSSRSSVAKLEEIGDNGGVAWRNHREAKAINRENG